MADEIRKYPNLVPGDLDMTFRDMGDGTFAPVIAADVVVTPPTPDPPDNATVASVPASATSVELLPATALRKAFIIFNTGKKTLYIRFGATNASLSSYTWPLSSHAGVTFPEGTWVGAIQGVWEAATTGAALVTEIT